MAIHVRVTCLIWHITAMKLGALLAMVGEEPVFETGFLLAGEVDPADVRRQLSRWVQRAPRSAPQGPVRPGSTLSEDGAHPFLVANRLVRGSYVSLHSALAHHGLIPEHVPVITSITTGRPQHRENPFGSFSTTTARRTDSPDTALRSLVEARRPRGKACESVADLIHIVPGADSKAYSELRLTNLERLDPAELLRPRVDDRPKMRTPSGASPLWPRRGRERAPPRAPARKGGGPAARNLAREFLQASILAALQRAGAMVGLAFQGGAALRFLYSIRRYSEDLDFALERAGAGYDFRAYLEAVRADLRRDGYDVDVTRVSDLRACTAPSCAFPGCSTSWLYPVTARRPCPSSSSWISRPPMGAVLETTVVRRHALLRIQHHDRASLLARKLHAILQRPYPRVVTSTTSSGT